MTALVAGPMAYQASQADGRTAATTPTVATTTTTSTTTAPGTTPPGTGAPPTSTPRPSTTEPDPSGFALPAPTTPPRATVRTPTARPPGTPPGPTPTAPSPSVLGTTTQPPGTTPPGTTPPGTTQPPLSGEGIVWARTEARNVLDPLAGATVTGRVWVYFEDPTADRVRFWLDDPDAAGPPRNIEEQFPFTLVQGPTNGQPAPLDTADLTDGPHSVRVEVTGAGGAVVIRLARFTVDN